MSTNWTCPFCNRIQTLGPTDFSNADHNFLWIGGLAEWYLSSRFIRCTNLDCQEVTLSVSLWNRPLAKKSDGSGFDIGEPIEIATSRLRPESAARVFPSYVPASILADYKEACLILNKSPKASATLSRRCLQGMIRDFWKIKKGSLFGEIEALGDGTDIDASTLEAIHTVRETGNIGAHMQDDVNYIVDVDADEAELLIGLLELLLQEWYVARHERKERVSSLIALGAKKKSEKTDARRASREKSDGEADKDTGAESATGV